MAGSYLICDEYIGEEVFLVYYLNSKWNVEQHTVNDGLSIEPYGTILVDFIPAIGTPYWVGKNFESILKTMPIVNSGQTGKKTRVSQINLYVKDSQEGKVNNVAIEYPEDGEYTGKIESLTGVDYNEEPQIEISTEGIYQMHMLALEFVYKMYER